MSGILGAGWVFYPMLRPYKWVVAGGCEEDNPVNPVIKYRKSTILTCKSIQETTDQKIR
jgi:hypothetical protein